MSLLALARTRGPDPARMTHRRTRAKRGASTIARAVPQLPAADDCQVFQDLRAPKWNTFSRPCAEPLDITTMFVDYECGANDCGDQDRHRRLCKEPDRQRKSCRPNDRTQRNVAGPGNHTNENDQLPATANGVRHKKAPTKLATALPPLKPRNTGISMSGHHRQSRHVPQRLSSSIDARDPNRQVAFGDIEQQGRHAGQPAGGPQNIGGADVAAARRADIAAGFPFAPAGNRKESSPANRRRPNQKRDHHSLERNSASLVYTEPPRRNWLW